MHELCLQASKQRTLQCNQILLASAQAGVHACHCTLPACQLQANLESSLQVVPAITVRHNSVLLCQG